MEINDICKRGEIFISELGKYYLSGGLGKKSKQTLKEIYAKHNDLFTYKNIDSIKKNLEIDSKIKRHLLSFLIQGYIGNRIFELTQEIVNTELQTSITINKRPISLRYGMLLLPAEKDREQRLILDQLLGERQDIVNPLREQRVNELKAIAREIGYKSYVHLIEDLIGIDLAKLKDDAEGFLTETEARYLDLLKKLERVYLKTDDKPLAKSDITYIFKSNPFDKYFPEIELIPTIEDTLFGMGINIHDQPNINLSLEREEGKSLRSFCCPISIPEEIHLVFNPKGGVEDYQTSLHETGHSQHYAFTLKELPFEYKRLGDKSVGEGYGFLFQQLTSNLKWIQRFLNVEGMDLDLYKTFITGYNLYMLRRFCGKLIYELEIFSGPLNDQTLRDKYKNIMESAVKVKVNTNNYLLDLDLGFNTPNYLRAWIFESYIRNYIVSNYGEEWYSHKESGDFLKSLWSSGNSQIAEEIVQSLGYQEFDMKLLKEYFS